MSHNKQLVGVVADPERLWLCGASYIPQIAANYGKSGSLLHRASELPDSAFNRTTSDPHGTYDSPGQVPFYVGQLRDELTRMIAKSTDNLFATGDALERVAWDYEQTDGHNAHGLKEIVKDYLAKDRAGTDDKTPIWTDKEREKQIRDNIKPPAA